MLNVNQLKDTFMAEGTDIEEFKALIEEVVKTTHFNKWDTEELEVLSYYDEDDENLYAYRLNPKCLPVENPAFSLNKYVSKINKEKINARGEALVNEMRKGNKILLYNENGQKMLFVSENLFSTMDSIGMKGSFLSEACFERDMMIAKRFKNSGVHTFVVKQVNNTEKIFAMLSEKYAAVKQDIIFDIIDKVLADGTMGKAEFKNWSFSHFFTNAYLEFPEKAAEIAKTYGLKDDFIPGLYISTSDTGDCSVTVRGTWRIKNSITMHNEVRKKHLGDVKVSELFKCIENEIYAEYAKLPEALCDLMCNNVTDELADPTDESERQKNRDKIRDVIENVFAQIDIEHAIGKRKTNLLVRRVCDEFDETMAYTAYDMATSIMNIPSRIEGLNKNVIPALQKACGNAPYATYQPAENTEITLLA